MKKGRYVYYHCTGYRGRCSEPYTREETLKKRFAGRLRDLVIPSEVIAWLQEELVTSDLRDQVGRDQALRRYEGELNRLGARLDTLYEDRLDGRIDASTYDQKAREVRERQQRVRTKITECQSATFPPSMQALDLMVLTSKAADLFQEQAASEQRRLLRLVLEKATWQAGELRMCFRDPFEHLRLSNSVTLTNDGPLVGDSPVSGIWRRERDSNP